MSVRLAIPRAGFVGAQPMRGELEGCPLEMKGFIEGEADKPKR
jgi:hypothetical protein